MWTFVGLSLLFCELYDLFYVSDIGSEIKLVGGIATILSIVLAPSIGLVIQAKAPAILLRKIGQLRPVKSELERRFLGLCNTFKLEQVQLFQIPDERPVSLAIGSKRGKIVISAGLIGSLEEKELDAVLAHELAHIKKRDALLKTICLVYTYILRFDPIIRLVEAAISREMELVADEEASYVTGEPLNLASALVKIQMMMQGSPVNSFTSLDISSIGKGLLSKHPDLSIRIERLLALAKMQDRKHRVPTRIPTTVYGI
jgi:Zn-dependent protease with chaperone function